MIPQSLVNKFSSSNEHEVQRATITKEEYFSLCKAESDLIRLSRTLSKYIESNNRLSLGAYMYTTREFHHGMYKAQERDLEIVTKILNGEDV